MSRSAADSWSPPAKLLHWLVALLVLVQIPLGWAAATWPLSPRKLDLFVWHKSTGMLILALMALRLAVRLASSAPALPVEMPRWERRAARASHFLLYGLLIGLPLTGWVLNSAANVPFRIFWMLPLPAIVGPDEAIRDLAALAHFALFVVLTLALLVHVGAALRHHFVQHDDVLVRMLPGGRKNRLRHSESPGMDEPRQGERSGVRGETRQGGSGGARCETRQGESGARGSSRRPMLVAVGLLLLGAGRDALAADWALERAGSRLEFVATFEKAAAPGLFREFDVSLRFDPDTLSGSRIDVSVAVTSADLRNADANKAIRGPEWFDFARFPKAEFQSTDVRQSAPGRFVARGTLTVKGVPQPLEVPFTWSESAGVGTMEGEVTVRRGAFGIGTGEWAPTDVIGADVKVRFAVRLRRVG